MSQSGMPQIPVPQTLNCTLCKNHLQSALEVHFREDFGFSIPEKPHH